MNIEYFIAIFLGGGIGSVLRYSVQIVMHQRIIPYDFPWSTFAVNIIGSFLIGLFYGLSAKFHLSEEIRLFLTAGLCGGFTTFSTFSNDSLAMLKTGEISMFALYAISSVVLGIAAAMAGAWLAK